MNVESAMAPSREQVKRLDDFEPDEPIWMISLQRFHETAKYADGTEGDVSGRAAYARYADGLRPLVERVGGRVVAIADLRGLLIGRGEVDFELMTILEFPDRQTWLELMASPEVEAISHHRKAGLEGQILLLASGRDAI